MIVEIVLLIFMAEVRIKGSNISGTLSTVYGLLSGHEM